MNAGVSGIHTHYRAAIPPQDARRYSASAFCLLKSSPSSLKARLLLAARVASGVRNRRQIHTSLMVVVKPRTERAGPRYQFGNQYAVVDQPARQVGTPLMPALLHQSRERFHQPRRPRSEERCPAGCCLKSFPASVRVPIFAAAQTDMERQTSPSSDRVFHCSSSRRPSEIAILWWEPATGKSRTLITPCVNKTQRPQ